MTVTPDNPAVDTSSPDKRINWIDVLRDVLTLKTDIFVRFRDSHDGLRYAIGLLVAVTLIANSLVFIQNAIRNPASDIAGVRDQIAQGFQQAVAMGSLPQAEADIILKQIDGGFAIAENVASLPTALPGPLARLLESFGQWLSTPFARLGGWLAYAIWVLLIARLFLGGTGSLRDFLATTPLYSVPQLLTILSPVPCLGPLLGIIAAVWGWVIYVKATAVSQNWVHRQVGADGLVVAEQTDWGRAVLAVILPAVLLFIVLAIGLVFFIVFVGSLGSGSGR